MPIALLLAIELILRISTDHGGYPPTIVEVGKRGDATVCITDKLGPASYFFANKSQPGSIETYSFYKPKPPNTIRVFLAGGSAIKGFPQPMGFAPSAFLQLMLREVWPDRRVEVINLGTTAVASFPVLGMVTESLAYEPDLIVVYSGHNEFFGAYGVASMHRAGNTPAMMKIHRALHRTAIVQWIEGFARPSAAGDGPRTLMELMVGQSYTAPDDPIRDAAARNLKANIGEIIELARLRGVPVMVCTLPSNERDLAPLGESDLRHLSAEQKTIVTDALKAAEDLSDASLAEAKLVDVLKICPEHARAHYLLGRVQYAKGQFDEARQSFQRAIDLDPMPWRCPERSMQALRETAKHGGAILCDVRQVFRDASPGGCIGWELMDDHVHPALAGQALVARAIVQALMSMKGTLHVSEDAYAALPSDEALAERLGDNVYDRYGAAHRIRVLCRVPFFRKTNPQAYERFNRICEELLNKMPHEIAQTCIKWQDPMMHPGAMRPITSMVGRVLIRIGRYYVAEKLYEIATRNVAEYTSWSLEYNYFMLVCRERTNGRLSDTDLALAEECIERGILLLSRGHSPTGMAERYIGRLHQLRGEWEAAIGFLHAARTKLTSSDLVAVDHALILSYVRTGRRNEAVQLIENGIANSGAFAEHYREMRLLLNPANWKSGMGGLAD